MKVIDYILKNTDQLFKDAKNSPGVFIFVGLAGMGATIYMVNKQAPIAKEIIEDLEEQREEDEIQLTKGEEIVENTKAVLPLYLPAIVTGAASTACILWSYKISSDRFAALATAYTFTNSRLTEYQKKVIESIGEKKEQEIRDEISKDKLKKHLDDHPEEKIYDIQADGKQWFVEDFTGKVFRASIQDICDGREDINMNLNGYEGGEEQTLYDLFDAIGIRTYMSDSILNTFGWFPGERISFTTSPSLLEDGVTTATTIKLYPEPHMITEKYFKAY